MSNRLILEEKLRGILGNDNVYFQPPSSIKLHYPCIIFELTRTNVARADNTAYKLINEYHLKHLFRSLKNEKKDALLSEFMMISHDNRFIADGLYNDEFTLFY